MRQKIMPPRRKSRLAMGAFRLPAFEGAFRDPPLFARPAFPLPQPL